MTFSSISNSSSIIPYPQLSNTLSNSRDKEGPQLKKRRKESSFTDKTSAPEVRAYGEIPSELELSIDKIRNFHYPEALRKYNEFLGTLDKNKDLPIYGVDPIFNKINSELVKQQESELTHCREILIQSLEEFISSCKTFVDKLEPTKDQSELIKIKKNGVDLINNSQKLILKIHHLSSFIRNQDQSMPLPFETNLHMMKQYSTLGALQSQLKKPHEAIGSFRTADFYLSTIESSLFGKKLEFELILLLNVIEEFSSMDDPSGITGEYQNHLPLLEEARMHGSYKALLAKINEHYNKAKETEEVFIKLTGLKIELNNFFKKGSIDKIEIKYKKNLSLIDKAKEYSYCDSLLKDINNFHQMARTNIKKIRCIYTQLSELKSKNSWHEILEVFSQNKYYIYEMLNKAICPLICESIKKIHRTAQTKLREDTTPENIMTQQEQSRITKQLFLEI